MAATPLLPAGRVREALRAAQRGAGIVEIMVGLLIGMLVILVVTSIFSTSENSRRTAAAMADAQVTGLLAQFTLVRDLQSGGSSITSANTELTKCADPTLHPIPVLITDGGAASDSFTVFAGAATRVISGVNTIGPTPLGNAMRVQSPTGFEPAFCAALTPCIVVVMEGAKCELRLATSAIAPVPGARDLTMTPALVNPYSSNAKVMNLGQNGTAMRVNYDVVANVLRSQDLITRPGPNPVNPIASNILMMKVQYGIDMSVPPDGSVDCWTSAVPASPCGGVDYTPASVQAFNTAQLKDAPLP